VRYGGPIVSVHGLCKALAARGHNVTVFTTSIDGAGDSDVPLKVPVDRDGVKVWYFRSTHLRRLYWAPAMAKALGDHTSSFDVVHLHSIFLWPTWAAARSARRAGVPYVLAPRGMLEKDLIRRTRRLTKSAYITLIERRNIEQAAAIHVTSAREAAEARAFGFTLPALYEVSNGVDLDVPSADGPISDEVRAVLARRPFLLFLGRLSWKKGLDRLIAALPFIPSVALVVAGNDETHYWTALLTCARDHGVIDRVVFVGPAYGADKSALLKHAQVLVLPSYSENFGNVVLEAMAAACPVVVTPEVGSADIVQQSSGGRVLPGDPPSLGNGIASMLAAPEALREMGRRGRKSVEAHYSWNAVAQTMESVYREVIVLAAPLSDQWNK
jgi:glycosyltransferase involved in cell wall biosynthesis